MRKSYLRYEAGIEKIREPVLACFPLFFNRRIEVGELTDLRLAVLPRHDPHLPRTQRVNQHRRLRRDDHIFRFAHRFESLDELPHNPQNPE